MKKITIVMTGLIISILFFVGLVMIFNNDNTSSISETRQGIPDVDSPAIEWNGTELFDSTVYYPSNNTCYGSRYGMNIEIYPCVAQSPTGKDIEQFVNFEWSNPNTRDINWIFVYDGELEEGSMDLLMNKSYTYIEQVHSLQWIADYLVDKVVTYTDLGSPTSACEIGSSLNNTKMYNVTRQNGTEQYDSIYCFDSVTPINATAFRISGWRDVYTPTEMIGYRDEWVDITDKIVYLGSGLLEDNRSYYKVQDAVTFEQGDKYETRWTYTPKNRRALGKWHIFGYDDTKTLIESIIADEYIYLDPWWDNDWTKKRQVTGLSGEYPSFNITYDSDMLANFSDLRFIDSTETFELNYTLRNKTDSQWAYVTVDTNNASTIYMYYGNPAGTSTSNVNDTFYFPTSYYSYDGGSVSDKTGSYSLTNDGASQVSGYVLDAYDFDGSADTMTRVNTGFTGTTARSFNMWVYSHDVSNYKDFLTYGTESAGQWVHFRQQNNASTWVQNQGTTLQGNGTLTLNTWHMVTFTYDGTNTKMFIDGVNVGTTTAITFNTGTTHGMYLGSYRDVAEWWNGYIDEIYMWNSAIDGELIRELASMSNLSATFGAEQNLGGINIEALLPEDGYITPNGTMYFQVNITANSPSVIANTTLFVWHSNGTLVTEDTATFPEEPAAYIYNWTIDYESGNYTWTANAYSNGGDLADFANRTFAVDNIPPVVTINSPIDATDYATTTLPINVTLNSTVVEDNLNSCWYYTSDDDTNITFTCNSLTNISFSSGGNKAIVVFANDTAGNEGSAITTFEIVYYTYDIVYDDSVVEGQPKNISITVLSDQMNTSILSTLTWDGTEDTDVSKSIINSTAVLFSTNSLVPEGSGNSTGKNISFDWRIYLSDGSINFTTNSSNQTIFSLEIDNCSSLSTLLLNYTMYDEDTRTLINGTNLSGNIQLDVLVTSILNSSQSVNVSREYSNTGNALVCISSIDTGFRVDAQARYTADDYVTEYHNIQNATLSASNFPQNISLYLLDSLSSQEFLITVKDTAFVPIADALVEITREYLPLGQFLTVEIPKTDYDGRTIGHFVLNDEVYTIYVKKNGVLIAVFENVRAFCSDVSTGDCRINLNAGSVGTQTKQFKTEQNVSFTQTYNDTTKVYKVTFTTTDSSIKTINVTVKKFDVFLNDTICSEELSSSSGSISCTIPASYYNNSVIAKIYVDDTEVSSNIFGVTLTKEQLNNIRWLFAFILVMTLPLLAITSAPMALIFFIIGVIAAGALALVDLGGYVGAFSALIWIIIAALILIWKATRPKEVLG